MDRAPPSGALRDAVGQQRWVAVFVIQAILSAAVSVLHLVASPRGRRHLLLGVPAGLLLALHPLLACAVTGLLALQLTAPPHPRPSTLQWSALATALLAAAGALFVGAAALMLTKDARWAAGLGFCGAVPSSRRPEANAVRPL